MNKEVQVNIDDNKNHNKYFISINIFFMIIVSCFLYGFIQISQETTKLSELIENGNNFFDLYFANFFGYLKILDFKTHILCVGLNLLI